MSYGVKDYFDDLVNRLGQGWNRFWYVPSDPLSMCALCACVGVLSLIWFWGVGQDMQFLFGENGLLPTGTSLNPDSWSFSLLDWIGDATSLKIVFGGGMLVLLAFTVGLFSRITSLLSLGLVLSVLHRKALLLSPFETVLVPVLLYLCIAPTGAALSVDHWLRRNKGTASGDSSPRSFAATIATRLLQIHLVAIYAMMALAKLRVGMWWQGSAVWWMTGKPDTRIVDFTNLPVYLLNAWTHAIVLFEGAFAALIWNPLARPILLALSVVMWGTLCLVTGDVLFSLLMIFAGFAFVSPTWLRASCFQCESSVAKRV